MSRSFGSGMSSAFRTRLSSKFGLHTQHATTGNVRRGAISTRSVLGDRHKHHLFLPSWQCSGNQGAFHRFPSATDYRSGMPLRGDEIRRRRKRHSSIEFLVDRVYVFRGFVRRQNWNVGHMTFYKSRGLAILLILRSLCGLVLCLVADPAERRGRHRTPYKLSPQ